MIVDQKTDLPELTDEERAGQIRVLLEADPPPMIQRSIDAFRNDLPELLKSHEGKWVAYHGDRQIGFGRTQTGLYQECFRRGLTRDDIMVAFVEPGAFDPDEEFEVTSDV